MSALPPEYANAITFSFGDSPELNDELLGLVLAGTRENMVRMQAIGFAPFPYRLTAFVISACVTALAGVMLANQAEFVSPSFMNWHRSGELIVYVVLGGPGTLLGPVVGTILAMGF